MHSLYPRVLQRPSNHDVQSSASHKFVDGRLMFLGELLAELKWRQDYWTDTFSRIHRSMRRSRNMSSRPLEPPWVMSLPCLALTRLDEA